MSDDEVQAYASCENSGCTTTIFGYGSTPEEAVQDQLKNQKKHNQEKHGGTGG